MTKDWGGNSASRSATLGVQRNMHQDGREEHDFYATDPHAVRCLLEVEKGFCGFAWEPAAGQGHIIRVLTNYGFAVEGTELYNIENPVTSHPITYGVDFLQESGDRIKCIFGDRFDIITNPPFKHATAFVRKAMKILPTGRKLALLLRILYLESKERNTLFKEYPFQTMYIPAKRFKCALNGEFEKYKNSNAMAYAWYVWEKGYKGESVVKFIDG